MEYDIVKIDYLENHAFLLTDGDLHYFQFETNPTLENALVYLFNDGKVKLQSQFYY